MNSLNFQKILGEGAARRAGKVESVGPGIRGAGRLHASTAASRPAPQSVLRMTPASEEDLLEAIAARRDRAAFQELFDRYHKQAYRLALYFSANSTQGWWHCPKLVPLCCGCVMIVRSSSG